MVHINAGIAGLVGALLLGKRIGFGKELMPPHSLTMNMIGAALLWVGWFGFNAGSNLEASGGAVLAMTNSFVATAAAALAWMVVEWMGKGKPSLLGLVTGAVAGLVAVTPASGYAGPMGAIVLGVIAGVVCFVFCSAVKNAFGYDDALDVFGVHCVGGIIGAILTGILVNPKLGGTGIMDYETGKIADYDFIDADDRAVQGGRHDAGVVRHRHADHPQGDRRDHRPARRRPTASAKASISPITASAPTTCEASPPRGSAARAAPEYGWGGDPAPPPPSRGLGSPRGLSLGRIVC